jgi:predicted GNAT superfamily acetyltransferase
MNDLQHASASGGGARLPLPDLQIRDFDSFADYQACVGLQEATWGRQYDDVVPVTILQITQKMGGIGAGAFTPDGRMIGFVYGVTGIKHGELAHWSHMLAVLPDYRDQGLGRRLKQHQRERLVRMGVEVMYWTYDPLVARNAHLNLNRLGATIDEYVADLYGDTGSPLHSFGTDRFVVRWVLAPEPAGRTPEELAALKARWSLGRSLNPGGSLPDPDKEIGSADSLLRVEVPADIEVVLKHSLDEARRWRESTRRAFQSSLPQGFEVEGIYRAESGRCFYALRRGLGAQSKHL